MVFDLLAAISLTAAAAVLIGVLSWGAPRPSRRRVRITAGLAAWFALVVALGATGALDVVRGAGAPGVAAAALLPILALGYAGTRPAPVQPTHLAYPLELLIGLNALRVLGAWFVLLYSAGRLPTPFAPVAGWGDVLIGVTAIPVALIARARPPGWRPIVLAWNALGLLDLLVAVGVGVASAPGTPFRVFFDAPGTAILSGLPWILIPAFAVPLLVLTHLAIFARLLGLRAVPAAARA